METLIEEKWLNTKEACHVLGVSYRTLVRWVNDMTIPEHAVNKILVKGRERKQYKQSFLEKIAKENKPKHDRSRTGHGSETPSEINDMFSHMTKSITQVQQNTGDIFLKIYQDHTKATDKICELKAKNATKRAVLVFFVLILTGVLGGSTWLVWNLFNQNQTLKLNHQTEIKEMKIILHKNTNEAERLHKDVKKKDSKIDELEQKIKDYEQKNQENKMNYWLPRVQP
jgi:excisionase family DNA binding protein